MKQAKVTSPRKDPILSVKDACRFLGDISPWTIHQWCSKGKLRRTKIGGRTFIRESELLKLIEDK